MTMITLNFYLFPLKISFPSCLLFTFHFLLHSSSSTFKVFLFLIMSSFLSDSAIGIGGSDLRGLIQQPLMDQEIISIGNSPSKDTHHGASDSESSSSERLRASRQIGGDTSCLRGRARPSAASQAREPILVTMILPLSAS